MKKLSAKNYIKNPTRLIQLLGSRHLLNWLSDGKYLKLIYRIRTGKALDLENPKGYNEKLQWLKINDRKSLYTELVDKFAVREHIKNTIGEEYLIPLIEVYDDVEEIDWEKLPNQFVLKCTHGSSTNIICKDKKKLNIEKSKRRLKKWLKRNWFWFGREWPYKNVKPRIIVEKYLNQIDDDELRDYRFFCFNGEPKFIALDYSITDKSKTRRNIYDLDWNFQPVSISYPNELKKTVEEPEKLEEMISLSRKLSKNIPHVRIDFYNIGSKIIFGEMTFYHQSGMAKIVPREFEDKMGSWIELPR